jgi:hypothetical protein
MADTAAHKDLVQRCADVGITRIVFGTPPVGRDVALGFLDRLAQLG